MPKRLGDKTYSLLEVLFSERYYMLYKFCRFLALNVAQYILVFVYYGFHETTFFIICISSKWENNKRKRNKNVTTRVVLLYHKMF